MQEAKRFYAESSASWDFSQMFGEEDNDNSDDSTPDHSTDNYISSLAFDPTGMDVYSACLFSFRRVVGGGLQLWTSCCLDSTRGLDVPAILRIQKVG